MSETGMLDEHQAPSKDDGQQSTPTYSPTPEEKKTLKMADKKFDAAKKHRKKYDEKWLWYYKMFRGKQWKEQRPNYRNSEVFNFIYQTIRSQVPIITDPRPRFEFLPEEPSDYEVSQIFNEVAEADWVKFNWSMTLAEMIYDGKMFGTGIGGMGYDPEYRDGLGAITFESNDPFYEFPDPAAEDFNKKMRYHITARPEEIDVIKKKYKNGCYVRPDVSDITNSDRTDLHQIRYRSPTDTKAFIEGSNPSDAGNRDQALLCKLWYFDDEVEEVEVPGQVDPLTGLASPSAFEQRKKYPNGRLIEWCSGVLLNDGPMEFEDKKIPRARFINGMLPREFWGISEIEPLEGPQLAFNKIMSFALDVMVLMGNPIWVVDFDSEVDTDNLFNRPGLIVEKAKGSEVRREEGVQLQPYVLEIADRIKTYIDSISGANDVTRGVKPDGVTAASAISQLQEAAQTRIRETSRFLDATLQDLGQQYKSRMLQFYSVPRIVRVTNNQNATKYFKFHIDNVADDQGNQKKVVRVRNYIQNEQTGKYSEDINAKDYQINGEMDVKVSTGSTLGFEKDRRFAQGKDLFEAGAIDEPELLKAADWPNWEAVWERNKQSKMANAQAEAQANAMAKGGTSSGHVPPPPAPQVPGYE